MKYGDIDISDLQMKVYDKDTSAAAVILGDFGSINLTYDQIKKTFRIVFIRHTRIKILRKDGYKWADQVVNLYKDNDIEEGIAGVSGTTYNLEGGKIRKSRLSKQSQFFERTSDNWTAFKFTMPDVREGSVIEYRYTIDSDYIFTLPVWYFQFTIPVVWSELKISLPEYYSYNLTMTGYEPLAINQATTNRVHLLLSEVDKYYSLSADERFSTTNLDYMTNEKLMAAKDVPAFSDEPYLSSSENYILKAVFELSNISFPGTLTKSYTESWETINKKMMEHGDFGFQLKSPCLFFNDKVDEINASGKDPDEKIKEIYEFIKHNMKWNNRNSCFTTTSLRSAFNDKSGSSGDINLLLTQMLSKAGFDANPVILSTRSNGIINTKFPILSKFNYVIASVYQDGRLYLLDASDPNCAYDILPVRCLNGNGLLISEKGPKWIELEPRKRFDYASDASLILDHTGKIEGSVKNKRKDYGSYKLREAMDKEKSEEDFVKGLEKNNPGLEITDFKYINREKIYEPVTEEYMIEMPGYADLAGDFIYVNPLVLERIKSNPFRLEDRKYPIDFSYPITKIYNLNLKIPEGYSIEEIPERMEISLPGNTASYSYNIEAGDNGNLVLTSKFIINKVVFTYDEYKLLKEFYNKIVQKNAETVVLKKIK